MYRVLPDVTVSKFSIRLHPEKNNTSSATINYQHTALGTKGEQVIADFTADNFHKFIEYLSSSINHFLYHGTMITEK